MMAPTPEKPPHEEEPVKVRPSKFDAKTFLERTLPQHKGDILKVTQISQSDSFRVNWYTGQVAQNATLQGLTILHIRESKFLFCRLDANGKPEITYPAKQ